MLITLVLFSAIFGFVVGLVIAIEKQRRKVKNFNKSVVPIEFTGVVNKSFPDSQFEIKNNGLFGITCGKYKKSCYIKQ